VSASASGFNAWLTCPVPSSSTASTLPVRVHRSQRRPVCRRPSNPHRSQKKLRVMPAQSALQALHGAQPVDSGSRLIAGRFRIGLLTHEPAGEILTTDPVAVAQHQLNCGLLDIQATRASPQHRDQPLRRRRRRHIPPHTDHPPYVALDATGLYS
jgi:hypothetical protein